MVVVDDDDEGNKNKARLVRKIHNKNKKRKEIIYKQQDFQHKKIYEILINF